MEWLSQAAGWLRELLSQQRWLDDLQPTIAQTPDWALVAAGPGFVLLLALLVFLQTPRGKKERTVQNSRPLKDASKHAARFEPPRVRAGAASVEATAVRKTAIGEADDDNRSVRVFVSSTFLDMQAERDELVKKAFPALRDKYRARGVEVFEVDLRWGITREMQERGEMLPTLLAEIDRCKPYFIGLLGDRYGSTPPPEALTDKLKADYPAIAVGMSLTAMEIAHGVLASTETAERAVFFERDRTWDWITPLSEHDRVTSVAESSDASAKLEHLKSQIRSKFRIEPYAGPHEIERKVFEALDRILAGRFPEQQAPDAFQQTERLHRAYARERRTLHIGAEPYLIELDAWMESEEAPPRLITGASGGGKSTLVANWLHARRKGHPNHIVFEHYLGASPDSADPMGIMRRLWAHLNHATGETVDPPGQNSGLMDVSTGLAQRLAAARSTAVRRGARIIVALDGLDKLSSEQNLRWLPTTPGVHVLASSLEGEAKTAALARGFAPLEVRPLGKSERQAFIERTLARWHRQLEPQHIARILTPAATELAGSPLYLKTVLDELRVSADSARLAERLEDYRTANNMADLFDRVLARLENDCEPGLVAKALALVRASRAGLEETIILDITGATPFAWATLRNGLDEGLFDSAGRMAFGHDYLSQAVATRYLKNDAAERAAHLAIADHFAKCDADARQAEELPFQLRAAEAWERLEALLVDLDRLNLLRGRGDVELMSYWLPLKASGRDMEALLCAAFDRRVGEPARWSETDIDLAFALASFLHFAGAFGEARLRLEYNRTAACEHVFGPNHPRTGLSLNNLAGLLDATNRASEAEPLYRRALAIEETSFGPHHPKVATELNNLATLLYSTNRRREAEPLFRRALAIDEASFGPGHPNLAVRLNNLAELLRVTDRAGEAELLFRRALAIEETHFGSDAPDVARSLNNLAVLLREARRLEEAEPLCRRALSIMEASFGPDHANVAICLVNVAELLRVTLRAPEAEPLCRRALSIMEASFGPDHPNLARSLNTLALVLRDSKRSDEAELLFRRALAIMEASFGRDHPEVSTCQYNLAELLHTAKQVAEAEALYRRALAIDEATFGPEDPKVAWGLNKLARLIHAANRAAEAEPLYRRALSIVEARVGPDHPDVAIYLNNVAETLRVTGRAAEAEPLYRRAITIAEANIDVDHSKLASYINNLAALLKVTDRVVEAEPLFRRALAIVEASLGPDHPDVATQLNNLALLLKSTNRLAEAEPLYRRALAIAEVSYGPDHPTLAVCLDNLSRLLKLADRLPEALPLCQRALDILVRSLGKDHPTTKLVRENLVDILATLQPR